VGRLDSNGSSDFNVWETGDTTDTSGVCPSVPAVCVDGNDSAERMEMVVGDHTPDVCLGSGTANELLSIPIDTVIWLAAGGVCPDPDGKVDPSDTLVVRLSQVLDLTTDQSFSEWRDFDKDGCCINGIGPNTTANPCTAFTSGPLGSQGKCLDTTGGTVTLAGTGTTASATGPLFDVTFSFMQPYLVTGPTPGGGSTCTTAPVMTFGGNATRCVP
jgi:hypothetical protein